LDSTHGGGKVSSSGGDVDEVDEGNECNAPNNEVGEVHNNEVDEEKYIIFLYIYTHNDNLSP